MLPCFPSTSTSTSTSVLQQTCLVCQIGERLVAIPATAVVQVCDYVAEPPFLGCAAWVGGFVDLIDVGTVVSVRLLSQASNAERRACRGALLRDGRIRWLVEIDSVQRLAEVIASGNETHVLSDCIAPAGWLSASDHGSLVILSPIGMGRTFHDGAAA